jgi:hypothetical protein
MPTARAIITLALEGMNKLAPGDTPDADLAAICLRRLNVIADDWSAGRDMAPQDQIVSGSVTGVSLTLATGSFAAIQAGEDISSMQADGYPMAPITMQQYNNIPVKTQTGRPEVWACDGLSTVFLYPAASSNTVGILTRKPFTQFADLDTSYTMPAGYQGAFAATLAMALAPVLLGGIPPALALAERKAMFNIANSNVDPAIVSVNPLGRSAGAANILLGYD